MGDALSKMIQNTTLKGDIGKHIWKLQMGYTTKNKFFECTCGLEKNQKVLEDIENLEKNADLPSQNIAKMDKPWVRIVDQYFEETTCERAEKSSLFWISKIET